MGLLKCLTLSWPHTAKWCKSEFWAYRFPPPPVRGPENCVKSGTDRLCAVFVVVSEDAGSRVACAVVGGWAGRAGYMNHISNHHARSHKAWLRAPLDALEDVHVPLSRRMTGQASPRLDAPHA